MMDMKGEVRDLANQSSATKLIQDGVCKWSRSLEVVDDILFIFFPLHDLIISVIYKL